MIPFKYKFEYFLFRFLLVIVGLMPPLWVYKLGLGFGLFCYYTGIRKSVVDKNLEVAFGESLSLDERNILCKNTFKSIGAVMFEVLLMRFISKDRIGDYIQLEGVEILKDALSENKGVIMVGSHFGNWELLSAAISTFAAPIYGYAGLQKNPLFDNDLNQIRQKFGTVTISKSKTATLEMMKSLKEGNIVGIVGDLNVPNRNLFIPFFGKPAAIGTGFSTFAAKRKTPVIFIYNIRQAPLKYKGCIKRLHFESIGVLEQDIHTITELYVKELETIIKEYPDHYFWVNRRWKTRPKDEIGEDIYN